MTPPGIDERSNATLERLLTLHPKLVDLSLGRMHRLLAALDHPENKVPPAVHVTGTNGKGSVLAFLRAMLEAAGYRVHVYVSPHLVSFHERIRLAGELIDEAALSGVLDECESANAGEEITFFEITTAAAFVAFSRTPADILLLENGLGGRLDATNVIECPALTAITPVSMDHQQFLGNTLAEIATEKAGIMKPGVTCVVGPQHPDAVDVIAGHADALQVPLIRHGVNWRVAPAETGFRLEHADATLQLPPPALAGAHQVANAGQAAVMARALVDFDIPETAVAEGIENAEWPARLQRLASGPMVDALPGWEVWLDGGHNPDAAMRIAEFAREAWHDRPLHLIAGMIESKDPVGYFTALAGAADSVHVITIPNEKAAVPAARLAEQAAAAGVDVATAENVGAAAAHLAADAGGRGGRVLICGSLYLAGQVLIDHA